MEPYRAFVMHRKISPCGSTYVSAIGLNFLGRGSNYRFDHVMIHFLMLTAWVRVPLLLSLLSSREGYPGGAPAVHMFIQCTSLLVEKAGVAPDVTLRMTACKQAYKNERNTLVLPMWRVTRSHVVVFVAVIASGLRCK